MSTVYQNGQPTGVVQLPQGAQMAPYGVQVLPSQVPGQSYDPGAVPPPPQQQQQGVVQQPQQTYGLPQQQFQPQPQVQGQGQALQGQQYQGQYAQGYPPQQQQVSGYVQQVQQPPQGAAQVNANTRLDGPGIPAELRGRTWGEALGIYSALRNEWLQRSGGQQQTPAAQSLAAQGIQQPAPQQQGFAGQQPQVVQQPGVGAPGVGGQQTPFWQNPEERIAATIDRVVQERIGPMLQPVVQQGQQQAIIQARGIAVQGIQDYQILEPEVMQIVASASPQMLADPNTWINAARFARGKMLEEGRYNAQAGRPAQIPGQGAQYPGALPFVPAGQQNGGQALPVGAFFTEAPTAPLVGQGGGMASQADIDSARRFGLSLETFMAWKTGQQQSGGRF